MSNQKKNKESGGIDAFFCKVIVTVSIAAAALFLVCVVLSYATKHLNNQDTMAVRVAMEQPDIEEMYLTPNKYSRPGKSLDKVNGVVVHYTANPGSSAKENRNYFEGLRKKGTRYASSHFVVGLEGEIVQCVPLNEIAYASNKRNDDTISIEVCHPDSSGKFNETSYESLVELVAWLCNEYGLEKDDIIRHYDVTGKMCPKYYVKHPKLWKQFKNDVFKYLDEQKNKVEAIEE